MVDENELAVSKELGKLIATTELVVDRLGMIESSLNNGIKAKIVCIEEHCKAHDEKHRGIVWKSALATILLVAPITAVLITVAHYFIK